MSDIISLTTRYNISKDTPVGFLTRLARGTGAAKRHVRFLPPCHRSVRVRLVSLANVRPSGRQRRTSIRLVLTIVGRHTIGDTTRVRRVRGTYTVKCRVRAATVHLYHPKMARRFVTKAVGNVTFSENYVPDFSAVLDVRNRVVRNGPSPGSLRDKHLVLYSTNTRAGSGCYSSRAHAAPVDKGFAAHRGRVCDVIRTYRSRTLSVTHPNVG